MKVDKKIKNAMNKRTEIGFISVDYNDYHQNSYKGYYLKNGKDELRIDTGDFFIDSILLKLFVESSMKSNCFSWRYSSSFDHFFMDGDRYKESYVRWNEEETNFEILDTNKMSFSELNDCDKVVMEKTMNGFDEYISYWKNWKEQNYEWYKNWRKEVEII